MSSLLKKRKAPADGTAKSEAKPPAQRGLSGFVVREAPGAAGPSPAPVTSSTRQPLPPPLPPPTPAAGSEALWVEKHAPKSSADLAMHKKKVEEVRTWLQRADASLQLGLPPTPRMLVLSGPPGSGKSTMLRVIAEELHFEICEWFEPRSDAWDPDRPREGPYESRMTQFGDFLRASLRTLSLCLVPTGGAAAGPSGAAAASTGMRRRLVLLDELPNAHNDEISRQLQVLLRRALATARFPIALVLCTGADSSTSTQKQLETLLGPDAQSALLTTVQVNPVADTLLTKAIKHVAAVERIDLPPAALSSLVTQANGDLRSALHSLQYASAGRTRQGPPPKGKALAKKARSGGQEAAGGAGSSAATDGATDGATERDRFLDLFHSIGSILNRPAKRAKASAKAAEEALGNRFGPSSCQPQEQCSPQEQQQLGSVPNVGWQPAARVCHGAGLAQPSDGFEPELTLQSSALEDASAAAFLQQSYLKFFTDADDAADAAEHLSDAALLVHAHRQRPWQTPLLPYISSLAARGTVTPNRHPAPSGFTQISRPQFFAVEKAAAGRLQCALRAFLPPGLAATGCRDLPEGGAPANAGQLTTEYIPHIRLMLSQCANGPRPLALLISGEQWQSIATLTAFGGGRDLPKDLPQHMRPSPTQSSHRLAAAAPRTTTQLIDDIEDD